MSLSAKSNTPVIDLHGEASDIARVLINDFIYDNFRLRKKEVIIIHGIGTGILKKVTHQELAKSPYILEYKIDFDNIGCTVAKLK